MTRLEAIDVGTANARAAWDQRNSPDYEDVRDSYRINVDDAVLAAGVAWGGAEHEAAIAAFDAEWRSWAADGEVTP